MDHTKNMKRILLSLLFSLTIVAGYSQSYSYLQFSNVNRSPVASNNQLWFYNNHAYVKLNGTDYQIDQQVTSGSFWKTNAETVLSSTSLQVGPSTDNTHTLTIGQSTDGLKTLQLLDLLAYDISLSGTVTVNNDLKISGVGSGLLQTDGSGLVSTISNVPLTATYVGYGNGSSLLTGEAAYTYNSSTNTVLLDEGTINVQGPNNGVALLVEDDLGNDIIKAQEIGGVTYVDITGTGNVGINTSGLGFISATGGVGLSTGSGGLNINTNGSWEINGSTGSSGQAIVSNGSGSGPTWQTVTTSAGGSDTQVQLNSSGSFAGDADLTFTGGNTLHTANLEIESTPSTSGDANATYLTRNTSTGAVEVKASVVRQVTVNIANAAILTMDSSPVTLIAAQGSGTYINILSAGIRLNDDGDNTSFNASDEIVIRSNTNEGTDGCLWKFDEATFNQASVNGNGWFFYMSPCENNALDLNSASVNVPYVLDIRNSGTISSGTMSSIDVRITYTVDTF